MSDDQLTRQGLRAFPPEIRNRIYDAACDFEGKMPDLIKALRQDQNLYKEVMHVFLASNAYTLHKKNSWTFGDMSKGALDCIQRLDITICTQIVNDAACFDLTFLKLNFQPLSGLQHVTFTDIFDPPESSIIWQMFESTWVPQVYCTIRDALNAIFTGSKNLRSITWITSLKGEDASHLIEVLKDSLEEITLQTQSGDDGTTRYVWTAKGGGLLEGPTLPLPQFQRSDVGEASQTSYT